jgi:hypothetical protein
MIKSGFFIALTTLNPLLAFVLAAIFTLTILSIIIYISFRWIEEPGIYIGNIITRNDIAFLLKNRRASR